MDLKNFTISQLKVLARQHKLHVSGTKSILEKRLNDFFKSHIAARNIQRVFRGWLAREFCGIHGPAAAAQRTTCVNDTDFVTLDPINEIEADYFFSISEGDGGGCAAAAAAHIYGFDIRSLISHISTSIVGAGTGAAPLNPYTRKPFPSDFMENIFKYIRIYRIFRPEIKLLHPAIIHLVYKPVLRAGDTAAAATAALYMQQMSTLYRLQIIREKPLNERIQNLFIDIDILGNYTSADWFKYLMVSDYYIFWNTLYDIWLFRAEILDETKKKICPIHDPFYRKMITAPSYTKNEILDVCLYAMENMIYMSADEEYRKLGATYVLMALTVVSPRARLAMPWLFEMLAY